MLDDAAGGPEAHCVVTARYRSAGRRFDGTLRLSKVFDLNPGFVMDAEKGRVVLGAGLSRLLFRPREDERLQIVLEPRGQPHFPRGISNFQLQLEDFVVACRGKRPPLVDGRQGLLSVRLLDQLYSTRGCLNGPGLSIADPRRLRGPSVKGSAVESMKVAVFGASGFVGSTLVEQLTQKSIDVIAGFTLRATPGGLREAAFHYALST